MRMHRQHYLVIFSILLSLFTCTTYAAHTYFGLQVGRVEPYNNLAKFVYTEGQNYTFPTEETGGWLWGMKFGYQHRINTLFSLGLETGFQYFHKFAKFGSGSPQAHYYFTYGMNSVPFFIVGNFHLPTAINFFKRLNFFIKGGYSYNELKATYHTDPSTRFPDSTYSEHNFNPVAAAGIGYTFYHFNVFVEYQTNWVSVGKLGLGEGTINNTNGRLGTASVGLAYLW